jgi:hypothetical protein
MLWANVIISVHRGNLQFEGVRSLPKPSAPLSSANGFAPVDFWMAWSTCRAARRRWLISDPLGYAEVEIAGFPAWPPSGEPRVVEVDFHTKPKQSGGLRLEVLPDVFTGTYLQAVADRLGERDLDLKSSLSARLFGLRLKQENPYEVWSSTVPTWIQRELVSGRVVVIADIREYFGSITRQQIEGALRKAALDEDILQEALCLIDSLNAVPDAHGATRSGLPVAPEEFFWLVADLVLGPVDEALGRTLPSPACARWVDDFLIATNPGGGDRALTKLDAVLESHGFRLNHAKTRVVTSPEEFERVSRFAEHRILNDLFLTQIKGSISTQQLDAFEQLIRHQGTASTEDGRLWKRLYGLAGRLRSPLLLERAIADLDRIPAAELQILAYLGELGWPDNTAAEAFASVAEETSETRAIGMLRTLVGSSSPLSASLRCTLRALVHDLDRRVHPFAVVLAFACSLKDADPADVLSDGRQLLRRLPSLTSASARRVGIELLWLLPQLRPELRSQIAGDPSRIVRGLQSLAQVESGHEKQLHRFDNTRKASPRRPNWGGLDLRIAHEFHLV